jgi:transcription antitermination factor NusG
MDTSNVLEELTPAGEAESWVVLHTRPRCEKKVQQLRQQRPAFMFLPCLERVHNYGPRTRRYEVPMFTGYVFARIRQADKGWYRQNAYVANLIEVVNETRFLEPLRAIAMALTAGTPMEVMPYLQAGQRIRVTGGSLKGLETEIIEVRGENRIVIQVEMIQQSVLLEIDPAYIQALSS